MSDHLKSVMTWKRLRQFPPNKAKKHHANTSFIKKNALKSECPLRSLRPQANRYIQTDKHTMASNCFLAGFKNKHYKYVIK